MAACASAKVHSGMPTCSTACAAAAATTSACGSALPTSSLARTTIRRTMKRGSSPPSRARTTHPPYDEARVLAAPEHDRELVERRVGIRATGGLDPRRDEVVV